MFTTLIEVEELYQLLDSENVALVDCRFSLQDTEEGRKAYQQSHVPGSAYAHLDKDLSGEVIQGITGRHPLPQVSLFAQKLSAWGIDHTKQVVAYDASGGAFASRLWWMLNWVGHTSVAVLDGGWQAWINKGFPITSQIISVKTTAFKPNVNSNLLVDKAIVKKRITEEDTCLLDARIYQRYLGEIEPIDPIAGHIETAICSPYKDNLMPDLRFKSKEAIKEKFSEMPIHKEVICYCGSGVTACHNILAMVHAGYPMPKLFVGSWSEWINDLPIL